MEFEALGGRALVRTESYDGRRYLESVCEAERAAKQGDVEPAHQLLGALVGAINQRHPYLSRRCLDLASLVGAHDVTLHFALCLFSATQGRRDSVVEIGNAAAHLPALADASTRVLRGEGRAEDWCEIAEADPHSSWPQITALCAQGQHSARTLDELRRAGQLEPAVPGGAVGWCLSAARVTWSGRSWAVGASGATSDGLHHFVPELSDHNPGAALRWLDSQPAERVSGVLGLIVRRFSFTGYYHWLLEGLQDVLVLEEAGLLDRLDRVLICVREPLPPVIADSLHACGLDLARFDIRTAPFDMARASVIKPMSDAVSVAHHVSRLRRRLLHDEDSRPDAARRLLVSRRGASWHRVDGEGELEAALAPLGFVTIVPGDLSFREQISAFSSAEFVVAPHGAALANLVFSNPGARVLELVPELTIPEHYRDISHVVGLRYARLLCPYAPGTTRDLKVDVSAVAQLVRSMLRESSTP